VKIDKAPPKDLPAFVKVYPGASQVMSMGMGSMSSIIFQTTSSPDDVVGYYRVQASSDGLSELPAQPQTGARAEQRQASFRDSTGGEFLMVIARPQQNSTMVSLTYRNAPKAGS
jgi:hypothetical protein